MTKFVTTQGCKIAEQEVTLEQKWFIIIYSNLLKLLVFILTANIAYNTCLLSTSSPTSYYNRKTQYYNLQAVLCALNLSPLATG